VIDYNTILQDRMNADTQQGRNIRKYLEEIRYTHIKCALIISNRERIGEEKAAKFSKELQLALDRIEQANEYSKVRYLAFPLDKNYIYFTIELMVEVHIFQSSQPEIGIRCRNQRTNEMLFLWRYSKFVDRLRLMEKWYADITDNGMLNGDYIIDPWVTITDEDIKRRQQDLKMTGPQKIVKLKERLADEYEIK